MDTKNCVRCGKPAKFWSGYVMQDIKKRKKVCAGWCSNRCAKQIGFSGQYLEWMGLKKRGI